MFKKTKNKIQAFKKKLNFKEHLKNSIYTFAYNHCKVKENVAFVESRTGEDLAGNMFRIAQGLQNRNVKLYIAVKKGYEEKVLRLIRLAGIKDANLVPMYSHKYYYVLATAKYLFNDVVFDWKYIKKEGQIYVNTWHGTPLKTLGYDVKGEQYLMGNGQRNLLMADYIAMPNKYCAKKLIHAYRLEHIFHGKILYSGYPRNQVFCDPENRKTVRENLGIQNKKVYVYMPTWRGGHSNTSVAFTSTMMAAFDYLDAHFTDDQILYVKLHNMMRASLNLSKYSHIKEFPTEYEPYEVLNCADTLITDYSSVFFDFASTKQNIVLFVPDKEEYFNGRGVYMTVDDLPFPQVSTASELLQALNSEEQVDYTDFIQEYCVFDSKDCTDRLLTHVMDGKKVCLEKILKHNGKQTIAIYGGNVMLKNGITTAFRSILNQIDTTKYNVYFVFSRKITTPACDFFDQLPDGISIFSLSSGFFFTLTEKFAYHLQQKNNINGKCIRRVLEKLYNREIKKLFYDAPFDTLIQFEGYGTNDTLPLFQRYPKRRVVFVHNDMVQEIRSGKHQHPVILKEAYQNYDRVAVVSPDLIEPTVKAGAPRGKITIVNNVHDASDIRMRAKAPITFERDTECRNYHPGGLEGVLNASGKKFITVGRFSPEKGHLRLLKAFDRFCADYPDSQLIIIGGYGAMYAKTVEQASRLKHWENVTVIKSIKNPMPILKRCDLFILPSTYEGLGLVLLEADCLGIPTFSTKIVGPTRLYQGFDGYLVESSEDGILRGMYDYMAGKVSTLSIDYDEYNRRAVTEFESLFMEAAMSEKILPAFSQRNIPVVFSSNDVFVPIMATMIQSIIENASAENNYDIIILTQDITMGYERKLKLMVQNLPNFSLRIVNVAPYIRGYDLYTENRDTITVETYFRLVLPDLLSEYSKVLYLDGDMIANADVAELYNTDISDYLLASSRDADGIGRCYKPGDSRKDYRLNTLKMKDLDNYFCAGTLLMNLEKFRLELPTKKLLDFATSYPWQWHDQDVLNVLCEGKTKMVHMEWDVLRDAGNNRYMPAELYEEYLESERNPKIIHYGGMRKPWLYTDVERGEYFWRYAGRTPFYKEILSMVNSKKAAPVDEKMIKDIALKQCTQGRIGPRYILKYSIAWLKYTIKHRILRIKKN